MNEWTQWWAWYPVYEQDTERLAWRRWVQYRAVPYPRDVYLAGEGAVWPPLWEYRSDPLKNVIEAIYEGRDKP